MIGAATAPNGWATVDPTTTVAALAQAGWKLSGPMDVEVSATGWHRLSAGRFPVAVLNVYGRGIPGYAEDVGDATEWIRARTWLGPLTNGTDVLGTEDDQLRTMSLRHGRSGGYVIEDQYNVARVVAARVTFGLASKRGLAYWILAGLVLVPWTCGGRSGGGAVRASPQPPLARVPPPSSRNPIGAPC